MATIGLTGIQLIKVLQDQDIIPKKLMITKVTLVAEPDSLVKVTYETNLPSTDAKVLQDTIIAMKAAERMDV